LHTIITMEGENTTPGYKRGKHRCLSVKGDKPIFFHNNDPNAEYYAQDIFTRKDSSEKHFHVDYPGNISKKAYRRLGPEDRASIGTFKCLFSRYKDTASIKKALSILSKYAKIKMGRTDEGFWIFPTDYGAHPSRTIDQTQPEPEICLPTESKPENDYPTNNVSTAATTNLNDPKSDSSFTLSQTSQPLSEISVVFMKLLAEKDLQIQKQSERIGALTQSNFDLTLANKAAQDTIQDLGKRIETMKVEHESERRLCASRKVRCEIAGQKADWGLPENENADNEMSSERAEPVRLIGEERKKGKEKRKARG